MYHVLIVEIARHASIVTTVVIAITVQTALTSICKVNYLLFTLHRFDNRGFNSEFKNRNFKTSEFA